MFFVVVELVQMLNEQGIVLASEINNSKATLLFWLCAFPLSH
jgi:hypothetical protein